MAEGLIAKSAHGYVGLGTSHWPLPVRDARPSLSSSNCFRGGNAFATLFTRNSPSLNCYQLKSSSFKSLDARCCSAGSSSRSRTVCYKASGRRSRCHWAGSSWPALNCSRVGRSGFKLTTARAEDEGGGGNGTGEGDDAKEGTEESVSAGAEEGRLIRWRNAVINGVVRFLRDFSRELKNETGFDSEAVRDSAVLKYEKLRGISVGALGEGKRKLGETREGVASAAQATRERYWPQFVNWNRVQLWKDVRRWDAQRWGALVVYALLLGSFLRGAQLLVTRPRSRNDSVVVGEAFMESIIPEPTQANANLLKEAMWRKDYPKYANAMKLEIGKDGEYKPIFSQDEPEETVNGLSVGANKLIEETEILSAEEKEELRRMVVESKAKYSANLKTIDAPGMERGGSLATDSNMHETEQVQGAIAVGSPQNLNWRERLKEWDKLLQEESTEEGADAISLPQVVAKIDKAIDVKERTSMNIRAFWVAKKWWKYRPKMPYTYFLERVQNLEVKAAVCTDTMKKLYVTMKEGFPSEYVVDVPVDPELFPIMEKAEVEIEVLHVNDLYYYGRIFLLLAPSVLIIWYIRDQLYQARERSSEKIYDLLSMNRKHLILPENALEKAKSQYKDVVVGPDVWQVIDEIMIYMRNPMKYHDRRVKLPRGILISGPPGTGKTLLARAIARESGLPFVFASGAEFVESSTGTGTDKVFDIFFTARANAPSFVFIDEIDALAGKNVEDDAERRATFHQLLSELDAEPEDTDVDRFAARQAVILICATNRPDELDEQFMRPGRIDREIYIGLPGEEERAGIFDVHSQGKRIGKDVDFSKLVFRTVGYSGADIRNLINEAAIMAVRKGQEEISQQTLSEVLDKQLFEGMGVVLMDEEQERAEQKVPDETKRLLAVHEAGHVLLAHLFPSYDWHAFSHLLPGGSENALSVFYPRQEMLGMGHTTVGYVMMQMVVAHGGRCAERLVYGDNITDGGQDDLQRISGMARELAISPANSRLGLLPMKWRETLDAPKLPGEVELIPREWDKKGNHIVNMSVELSEVFTREVTKYIDDTEEVAMTALSQNRHILEKLADILLSKTKLSGLEAQDIIKAMDPVLLPDYMDSEIPDLQAVENQVRPPNWSGRYEDYVMYPAPLHRC